VDEGFDVDYYVRSSEECVINGVHVKPLKSYVSRVQRFLSTFALLPKLLKSRYDAVHLVDPELLPLGIILKLFTKTVVVFDAHEDYVEFMKHKYYLPPFFVGMFTLGIKFVLYVSSLILDGFVFADKGTAEEFKKLPPARKSLFYNFPVLSMFPDKPQEWAARKYDAVFLGTMSRTSGMLVMLKAIGIVKNGFPALKCLFIGEPEYQIKPEVDEYIRRYDLDGCAEFTGRVPHGDVPKLLQECKVGLVGLLDMPKFSKNIATKIFEYMASGMPVVSSDLPPERKYIVSDKCGYLVPPENPAATAEAICRILSDAKLGQKMSKACRRYMLEHNYFAEDEVGKLVAFYNYLLAHRRRLLCAS